MTLIIFVKHAYVFFNKIIFLCIIFNIKIIKYKIYLFLSQFQLEQDPLLLHREILAESHQDFEYHDLVWEVGFHKDNESYEKVESHEEIGFHEVVGSHY